MSPPSSILVRPACSPSLARRLARRRLPSRSFLHTTSPILAIAPKPEPSLIAPSTALSSLLSRLSLPSNSSLHSTLTACLTHPSYYSSPSTSSTPTSSDELPELELVNQDQDSSKESMKESNELLSNLGNSLLGLFASEHLTTLYPLLPTTAVQSAITAYVGPAACSSIARELGISVQGGGNTSLPGYGSGSNSAGLPIRWSKTALMEKNWQEKNHDQPSIGPEKVPIAKRFEKFLGKGEPKDRGLKRIKRESFEDVIASTVRAFVGMIYQEQGIHAAREFVHAHFLSRSLDLSTLFNFKNPLHVLTSVVASHLSSSGVSISSNSGIIERRILASTGINSQSPLFLIGLFLPSGIKLSEGHGSSKSMAEHRAAVNALLSLFLVRGDQPDTIQYLGIKGLNNVNTGLPTSIHHETLLNQGKINHDSSIIDETSYKGNAWGGKDVLAESASKRKL
ncbi:uncharacterized protein IL334_001046 [Kwoniella shivajii]|uniref:Large ribosomal subunit protein mL44 n=1 Tax=Kwoniella shivajii TaxID=564305 RepID=A0ABZ1CQV0_9TREE|nr:hypothetical protein IL334_001046 [Kwoniella shivajii]